MSILREAAADQRIGGHLIPKGTALQARSSAMSQDTGRASHLICKWQTSMAYAEIT